MIVERDTDRECANQSDVTSPVDGKAVPFRERLKSAVDGFQKIVAVRLNVEADEICAEKSVEQFALPRTNAEDFRIRPGNVPEDGDASIRTCFLDQARHQGKVIVLNEDNRILRGRHFLESGIGEALIHFLIVAPVFGPKNRPRVRGVT